MGKNIQENDVSLPYTLDILQENAGRFICILFINQQVKARRDLLPEQLLKGFRKLSAVSTLIHILHLLSAFENMEEHAIGIPDDIYEPQEMYVGNGKLKSSRCATKNSRMHWTSPIVQLNSTSNKNFPCNGQLIIMTPIQAVKLPSMTVTRLLFCFVLFASVKFYLICFALYYKLNFNSVCFTVTMAPLGSISCL